MLYTPGNQFNWHADTFTDDFVSTNVTLTAGGSAHTKGSNVPVMNGLTEDCYGIFLLFAGGETTATIRRQMVDLLIDPDAGVGNAGSSWSVLINNLYLNSPSLVNGAMGHQFFFPLFLKAGTAIGARTQDVVASGAVQIGMRVWGKPTRPELLRVGTKVQTLGATPASTTGVALTMGVSGVIGAFSTSLGTLTHPAWWWQLGIGSADTIMVTTRGVFDIAEDATSKYLCAAGLFYCIVAAVEGTYKTWTGDMLPVHEAAIGQDVYVRGTTGSASFDTGMTAVVYAMGG